MLRSISIIFCVCCLFLAGCVPSPYYQHAEPVPGNSWDYHFAPVFKFNIEDTTVPYKMSFLIRHTEAYPFSNIWLLVSVKQPGDTKFSRVRIEVPLAERSGKWLGRGMGEIWEQLLSVNYQMGQSGIQGFLRKRGAYEIKLEQNMRVNPLPDVLQAGLRIEKNIR